MGYWLGFLRGTRNNSAQSFLSVPAYANPPILCPFSQVPTCGQGTALAVLQGKEEFSSPLLLLTSKITCFIYGAADRGTDFLIVTGPCLIPVWLAAALLSALQEAEHLLAMCPFRRHRVQGGAWRGLKSPTFCISCICSRPLISTFIVQPILEGFVL